MQKQSDETLVAYLDGELDSAGQRDVEAWLDEDPSVRERLVTLARSTELVHKAYADIVNEPVPERLIAAARGTREAAEPRAPTAVELSDLRFAFRVVKHVKSNAIVYARDRATVGIGAGQMSRVDAARIAARKAVDIAAQAGLAAPPTRGSVVASDAFFPFADGLLVAIEAGATAVIQPGGSVRDEEVIKAADDRGIAMVFTGTRHFRH